MAWKGYFDGGSRGNPGIAGAGAVLYDENGSMIWEGALPLGKKTNNEAEYEAAGMVLKEAARRKLEKIEICGDSKLVINQLSGVWKIKEPRLQALFTKISGDVIGRQVKYRWVPRAQNSEADRLANLAMDGERIDRSLDVKIEQTCDSIVSEEKDLAKEDDFMFEFLVIRDGDERYSLDLIHSTCSCPDFIENGTCRHLKYYSR